jgi:AAA+ ATPase superfamily predicted ATPase
MSWPKELIGRDSEIKTLRDWIDGDAHRTIVIYGSIGVGKSSLMAQMLQEYKDRKNIFWYQMPENDSLKTLLISLSKFLSQLESTNLASYLSDHNTIELDEVMRIIEKGLKNKGVIAAFDNYFKVNEALVDFFSALSDLAVESEDLLLMITASETTPFFCRFYDKHDTRKKKIAELTLKGLDMKDCKQLLGTPNIDEDSLRKIHLLTHGHPLTLELIKLGDVNNLKRIKGFSRQEASLLLYLKGVEREP